MRTWKAWLEALPLFFFLVHCSGPGGGTDGGSGGSSGSGGGSSTGGGGATSILPGSDTFDGSALDPSWQVLHPEAVDIAVSGGSLTLELTQAALWFNSGEGVLVYKLATGD